MDEAEAGDIIAISGLTTATVADTICDTTVTEPIYAQPIDPPTLTMTFRITHGPLAGKEGDKVQSRVIRDRLLREAEGLPIFCRGTVNRNRGGEKPGWLKLENGFWYVLVAATPRRVSRCSQPRTSEDGGVRHN